ncbi:MAG TPA: glycosyltransferase family 2 protein, partial [Parachlamydiaceae bacterium]|nr:glycosyltransferase family 2 protein [Parachlamydiaceae bacterium]
LNTKYSGSNFYLFHRNRKLNHHENCWMGWERKRGKLENLNSYLSGSEDTDLDNFLHEGDSSYLTGIVYVLTADSDTQLPKDSVRRMVETLSHPLNAGYLDPVTKKLLRGYTIIQPRVSTNYLSANSTWFAKLFSDPSGIDPYTKSTSDIYQDLFHEGVYHGKGLYNFKLFHEVLSERLPENKILSHDLLEGSYVNVAFASDIEVYDSFPDTYALYAKRQHRWVRGDWQLLNWLGRKVTNGKDEREKNPLSLINSWKIFDNLRRSLLPVAALGTILFSWLTPYFMPWTLLIVFVVALPIFLQIIDISWITLTKKLISVWNDLYKGVVKAVVTLALLPHQAWINANAICKTLFRQFISHTNLLQWTVSSAFTKKDTKACLLQLGTIAALAFSAIIFFVLDSVPGLAVKIPLLLLWLSAPVIYRLLNMSYLRNEAATISQNSAQYLGVFSRKTWRYFDDFVDEVTHYLPPDNYQEKLKNEVAYRTSPTNIGLYMMSASSAYRFGYITASSLIQRLGETVTTLKQLERYEGHFLNWYDIKNISPLLPKYVSTVDSGNLLASFWAAEEQCKALLNDHVMNASSIISAIADNLHILNETLSDENSKELSVYFNNLGKLARSFSESPLNLKNDLDELQSETMRIIAISKNLKEPHPETLYWLQKLQQLINDNLDYFDQAVPWISLFSRPEALKIVHLHPEGINWKKAAVREFPTFQNILSRNIEGVIPLMGWLQTLPEGKFDT